MAKREYGIRKCMQCGAEFTAEYPAQLTCSQECRKARGHELAVEWEREARRGLRDKLIALKKDYAATADALAKAKALLQEKNGRIVELEDQLKSAQNAGTEQLMPLREELAAAKGEIARLQDELKAAKEEAAHAKEELAKALKAAAAPKKSGKYVKNGPSFCPRLSMVGPGLPCGEKPECYKQSVCKHVPDGATVPAA